MKANNTARRELESVCETLEPHRRSRERPLQLRLFETLGCCEHGSRTASICDNRRLAAPRFFATRFEDQRLEDAILVCVVHRWLVALGF